MSLTSYRAALPCNKKERQEMGFFQKDKRKNQNICPWSRKDEIPVLS